MKIPTYAVAGAICCAVLGTIVRAQLGGPTTQEWSTSGGDAQRSSWIRYDSLISKASLSNGRFSFLWKFKVNSQARQLNPFSNPMLVANAMGFKGFRSLVVLMGPNNTIYAVDDDFGTLYWDKHFDAAIPVESTASCPGGMTAAGSRIMNPDPATLTNRGPVIRSPFRSGLSEPGEGAPVESPGSPAGRAGRAGQGRAGGRGRGRGPSFATGAQPIVALTSDGILHFVSPVTAKELLKPLQFLPANANATDLAAVSGVVYTATVNGCGGVPNAVWAIDPNDENPQPVSWKTNGGSVAGTVAFGRDATVFAAIGDGTATAGGYTNAIVALDPKTLQLKDWFTQPGAHFVSSPVVFVSQNRQLLAAATTDGRFFLLDTASLGGADHATPLAVTSGGVNARGFASYEDEGGTRWLLAATNAPNEGITAWKVSSGAKPALEKAWSSAKMVSPLAPIIVNGVVFAASSGEYRPGDAGVSRDQRAKQSGVAVLYALDAETGREIWNSGSTVTSFAHQSTLSSSQGQVYLLTADGTVYAFGIPWERQ